MRVLCFLLRNRFKSARGLRLKAHALATLKDITGHRVDDKDAHILSQLDEAIASMITLESDSCELLAPVLAKDSAHGLANGLLAFELLRQPRLAKGGQATVSNVHKSLATLEQRCSKGELGKREVYIAAAALSYYQGDFMKSGALLESSLLYTRQDVLALKLAQDAYLAAGSSANAMGCVARWLHAFDDGNPLHGHVTGMMAAGFLEVGRYSEAEECATRAVRRTNGRDVWALHTLLNTYLLMGRSSEVLAVLEDHISKHDGIGLQLLLFNKGVALVQRGNYTGALRVHDDMVDNMGAGPAFRIAGSLTDATLLLWLVGLNSSSDGLASRWKDAHNTITRLWAESGLLPPSGSSTSTSTSNGAPFPLPLPRLVDFTISVALTGMAFNTTFLQVVKPGDGNDDDDITVSKPKPSPMMDDIESMSKSIFGWIRGGKGTSTGSGSAEQTTEKTTTATDNTAIASDTSLTKQSIVESPVVEIDPAVFEAQLREHLSQLDKITASGAPSVDAAHDSRQLYPTLSVIQPDFQFHSHSPSAASEASEARAQLLKRIEFSQGIAAFGKGDYQGAAQVLMEVRSSLSTLGGTAAHRDIVAQTITESLIRSDRLTEARLLLCERTALAPNDAQSWRRLVSIFSAMNMPDHAQMAQYTTWQLGIGQGGFGGPK